MTRADYLEAEFAKVLIRNKTDLNSPEYLLREWDRIRALGMEIETIGSNQVFIVDKYGANIERGVIMQKTDGIVTIKLV